MRKGFSSDDFLWLVIGLFLPIVIAFRLPVAPNDYWWFLRLGQDVLQTGHVPAVETYSVTQIGQPITYQSWLSAVLLWKFYDWGGIPLTIFARGLVLSLTLILLWLTLRMRGSGPRLAASGILLVSLLSSNNWSVRPQLLAYPLFVLTLWIVWQWHSGQKRWVWVLPPLALLWTNLHGSFILLFALAGLGMLFGRGERKSLILALLLAGLATLVNPYGFGIWRDILATFTSASEARVFSMEWRPPVNNDWQMNLFFGLLLLFPLLAGWSSRKLERLDAAIFLAFGWMALSGLRYVIWFEFLLMFFCAYLLQDWDRRFLDREENAATRPAFNLAVGVFLLLFSLLFLPGVRDTWMPKVQPAISEHTPLAATAWLADHPELPGPLWADDAFGSYLIFALPSRPVWIDTRVQVAYPAARIKRYLSVSGAEPGWQAKLDEDGINLVMLSPHSQPLLLSALRESPSQWCRQYEDKAAVIFSRCQPK